MHSYNRSHHDVVALLNANANASLANRLRLLGDTVPGDHCLTTSFGIEDQLLTAVAVEGGCRIRFATLDTGRLFDETQVVWRETEQRYGIEIRGFAPPHDAVRELVARDGQDGFRESIVRRHACCDIRKAEPLSRALQGATAWITGLRAEQSVDRAGVVFATFDPQRGLIKVNPLFDWTRDTVLAELRARNVPISALEARGYRSVGCEPCTRALKPGEPERAGRWWWESQAEAKECGLHVRAGA